MFCQDEQGCGSVALSFFNHNPCPASAFSQQTVSKYRRMSLGASRSPHDRWGRGDAYEPFVGRWSRLVAQEFLKWLTLPPKSLWLDIGSGTGALSQVIINDSDPSFVAGLDRSEEYVRFARSRVIDVRAAFEVGDAMRLPVRAGAFDAAVSGLALNFVPQPSDMVSEMRRAIRAGGIVAAYVWDYSSKMELLRYFWDAVASVDPAALELDEGRRFPICDPVLLHDLFQKCDLSNVEAIPIDIETRFRDFDDYWTPFLGGQGPAPSYTMSLPEEARIRVRNKIHESLPITADGSIRLIARAWAVKGSKRVEK